MRNNVSEGDVLTDRLQTFIGREGEAKRARDPVNAAMIRHWRVAIGDRTSAHDDVTSAHDDVDAARSAFQADMVAPPAMLQVWTMPGPDGSDLPDAVSELYALLDDAGYTGLVATNSDQTYCKPVCLGDVLTSRKVITAISDEKRTGLGQGFFITSTVTWTNQDGEVVGTQLHRVLKFMATEKPPPLPVAKARRPHPNVTLDTAFFFEGAKRRQLLIQGCDCCGTLQHPPMAACRACGSLDLTPREMIGKGNLFSYTIVHAPVIAPFEPPYPVILVELEEGPRIVSELHGVPLDQISIGMPLRVDFIDSDPDLSLPIFRSAAPRG